MIEEGCDGGTGLSHKELVSVRKSFGQAVWLCGPSLREFEIWDINFFFFLHCVLCLLVRLRIDAECGEPSSIVLYAERLLLSQTVWLACYFPKPTAIIIISITYYYYYYHHCSENLYATIAVLYAPCVCTPIQFAFMRRPKNSILPLIHVLWNQCCQFIL